jgi:hypothetical protein
MSSKDVFISYSRRDQEFVVRLAHDLNAQVTGVWFDQSAIQTGQKVQQGAGTRESDIPHTVSTRQLEG